MKHKFRIIVGMLLLAIPLCMNAQVKPVKPQQNPQKNEAEIKEKQEAEKIRIEQEKLNKPQSDIKPQVKPVEQHQAKPADAPEKPEKDKPKLGDYIQLSGFVQGMYQANLSDEGELTSNTFRMRRVRLSVSGTLFKGLTYKIQGDFVNSPFLVDAFLKYKPCKEFAIQVGQFKTPFSIESPINPVNLEIFDYGEGIQSLVGYSDVCGVGGLGRDIGIMATGDLFYIKSKEYSIVNYSIGVFNGNGPVNFKKNEKGLDNNNRKDIVGRLEVHPGLKNLTLSGSYYYGKYTKDDNDNCTRNRWAAGAQYNDGKLVIRGEYLNGTTGYFNDIVDDENNPIEQYQFSKGYYAVAGYNFKLGKEGKQTLMPVLRYEHFEPGDKNSQVLGSTNYYTVGVNYWPLKSLNFKLDYSLVQQVVGEKTNSHRVVGILSYKF